MVPTELSVVGIGDGWALEAVGLRD